MATPQPVTAMGTSIAASIIGRKMTFCVRSADTLFDVFIAFAALFVLTDKYPLNRGDFTNGFIAIMVKRS